MVFRFSVALYVNWHVFTFYIGIALYIGTVFGTSTMQIVDFYNANGNFTFVGGTAGHS